MKSLNLLTTEHWCILMWTLPTSNVQSDLFPSPRLVFRLHFSVWSTWLRSSNKQTHTTKWMSHRHSTCQSSSLRWTTNHQPSGIVCHSLRNSEVDCCHIRAKLYVKKNNKKWEWKRSLFREPRKLSLTLYFKHREPLFLGFSPRKSNFPAGKIAETAIWRSVFLTAERVNGSLVLQNT